MADLYCYAPWSSLYIDPSGTIKPCCVSYQELGEATSPDSIANAYKSKELTQIRKMFLAGERPNSCRMCYKKDALGIKSRKFSYPPVSPPKKTLLTEQGGLELIDYLDISFSNVCNLRCRFCGPFCSSRWIEDSQLLPENVLMWQGHKEKKWKMSNLPAEHILEAIKNLPNLSRLDINGGEPFLSKDHLAFIRSLSKTDRAKEISLIYTTNGTVTPKEFIEPLQQFKSISLAISSEGVGNVYRYSRGYNEAEVQIERAIDFYSQLNNIQISVNFTLFALNIFGISDFWSWYCKLQERYKLKLSLGVVVAPPALQVRNLPFWFRQMALEKVPTDDNVFLDKIRAVLINNDNDPQVTITDNDRLALFWTHVKTLDQIQKTSLTESQPIYKMIETPAETSVCLS